MIRTLSIAAIAAALLSSTALVPAHAQPKGEVGKYSNVQITGHIIEPKKVDANDERIAGLKVPPGFKVSVFARDVVNPRILAVGEEGQVYASRRFVGDVIMLKDTNNDGVADERQVVANRPNAHGLAIHDGKIYLITVKEVFVANIKSDGTFGEFDRLIDNLPDAGQHANRTIGFGPDGMLYISIGSTCNECQESNVENATMLRARPDGTQRAIFASGLRNTIGFGWHPQTNEFWGMDHGIDWLGDDEQPEELNLIVEGKKYGWPFIYADSKSNPHMNPPADMTLEQWAKTSEVPALTYTAHAAPMQMAFYGADQFPADYKGDAFVAMRGSWNRNPPSGYEVVRIKFENGKPVRFEPFLTGFMSQNGDNFEQFGRLVGVAVAKDGALLVGDDESGVIYRVSYDKAAADAGQQATPAAASAPAPTGTAVGTGETQKGKQPTPSDLAKDILKPGDVAKIEVTSDAFGADDAIPLRYSDDGEKLSPPLSFDNLPKGAKSIAVLMEDPDVPENMRPFVHWIIANLPGTDTELREGVPTDPKLMIPATAIQGANSAGSTGYFGPKPPVGDDPHHYHFQVFALDTLLDVAPGAGRKEFLDAMQGRIVGYGELVGTFERAPGDQPQGDPKVLPDDKQEKK
ncbi:YbhB/YbcL family Raf kinase inhibitor-like protein [Terrihabitans sp. B22-R8]|uniref:YbhB/YbcL family Raf kinase inhibitor-like protein n=1 Tax=Terrihabitans sp. B22-R8 TaxID=3425128 RepID=UPI00403C0E60